MAKQRSDCIGMVSAKCLANPDSETGMVVRPPLGDFTHLIYVRAVVLIKRQNLIDS